MGNKKPWVTPNIPRPKERLAREVVTALAGNSRNYRPAGEGTQAKRLWIHRGGGGARLRPGFSVFRFARARR